MKNTKITAEQIKQVRKEIGLTQIQLAQFVGVSVQSVRMWENGTVNPKGANKDFLFILFENKSIFSLKSNKLFVGGSLWLDSVTSIPQGFNPTVGGDLWLSGLTSIPQGIQDLLFKNADRSAEIENYKKS